MNNYMPDGYETFYKMFLAEMPLRVNGANGFDFQVEALKELVDDGYEVTPISSNTFKIEAGNQVTYWVGDYDRTVVLLVVDTEINNDFCRIMLTSKNPTINKSSPPYASDLYSAILRDANANKLVLTSDTMLSDDAIGLWGMMRSSGYTVSVFDRSIHQYILANVTSKEELNQFVGDVDHNKYVFVLSEDAGVMAGLRHSVDIMEIKRKSDYPLNEMFVKIRRNNNA